MGKIVNVFGATGLVGRELVKQLVNDSLVERINLFVRRSSNIQNNKVYEFIVDFNRHEDWEQWVTGDAVFITMGTTRKQAGSKFIQHQVDFTYQYLAARAAAKNGIPMAVLVSSSGANEQSRLFYSRIKGELDLAVQQIGFKRLIILRPSLLTGKRDVQRRSEELAEKILRTVTRFIFKKYRPIPGATVARAMIEAISNDFNDGLTIVELEEIFTLAGQ